jgi:hypothetical protein
MQVVVRQRQRRDREEQQLGMERGGSIGGGGGSSSSSSSSSSEGDGRFRTDSGAAVDYLGPSNDESADEQLYRRALGYTFVLALSVGIAVRW